MLLFFVLVVWKRKEICNSMSSQCPTKPKITNEEVGKVRNRSKTRRRST